MLDIDEYLFFLGVHMLALISPGPDFLIVSRHALKARRLGVITGFGIATGLLFHITYCILGLGFIIAESPMTFMVIKYTGAAYLSFIGLRAVWHTLPSAQTSQSAAGPGTNRPVRRHVDITERRAFGTGVLTNILNPKCAVFTISLFASTVTTETSIATQVFYGANMIASTLVWFSLVSVCFSTGRVQRFFTRWSTVIDRSFGCLLVVLGIRVAIG